MVVYEFFFEVYSVVSVQCTTVKTSSKTTIVKLFADQSVVSALPTGWGRFSSNNKLPGREDQHKPSTQFNFHKKYFSEYKTENATKFLLLAELRY